ncbi:hypothetical protein CSA56_15075 [candidate division KSB3 bacterium]|uniref:Uncharacterized protein n=1 Tax=candidate division KSB3 bacterium TaxID=2044937 RepID=A0A2G6KA56_9BACT|nr:MAG: hypothetical protein CSA56_15075 [candidate division KSB3 bacterium]
MLGPLFYLKHRWKLSIGLFLVMSILTIITQVGGLIIWVSLPFLDRLHIQHHIARQGIKILCFLLLYLVSILVIMPILAPFGGRVPLP